MYCNLCQRIFALYAVFAICTSYIFATLVGLKGCTVFQTYGYPGFILERSLSKDGPLKLSKRRDISHNLFVNIVESIEIIKQPIFCQ